MEVVLLTKCLLLVGSAGREIRFPSWAEIDVPSPETAQSRLWLAVVVSTEFTVGTNVCHNR